MTLKGPFFAIHFNMRTNSSWLLASYHIQDFGVKGLSDLALSDKQRELVLEEKRNLKDVKAVFYIQTCNRIEYLYCLDSSNISSLDLNSYLPKLTPRIHTDLGEIIEHMLSVCLSKDSLVIGENQIFGQFKQSFKEADKNQLLNKDMRSLLQWIIREAKSIRNALPFRHFPSSLAVLAAKRIYEKHKPSDNILFIGAGETNEIVSRFLYKKGFQNFYFVNRTFENAKKLAAAYGATAIQWKDLSHFKSFDALVCATNAKEILVDKEMLENLQVQTAVDLSVPINITTNTKNIKELETYNVSDFEFDIEKVKQQSQQFLWDLQAKIIDSKFQILKEWRLYHSAPILKNFRESQEQSINKICDELKLKAVDTNTITNIRKELNGLCYQQILDLRKQLQENENC